MNENKEQKLSKKFQTKQSKTTKIPFTWLKGELRSLTQGNKNRVKRKRAKVSQRGQRRKNKDLRKVA